MKPIPFKINSYEEFKNNPLRRPATRE